MPRVRQSNYDVQPSTREKAALRLPFVIEPALSRARLNEVSDPPILAIGPR